MNVHQLPDLHHQQLQHALRDILHEQSLLFQVVQVHLAAAMNWADWPNPALRAAHLDDDGGTAGALGFQDQELYVAPFKVFGYYIQMQ